MTCAESEYEAPARTHFVARQFELRNYAHVPEGESVDSTTRAQRFVMLRIHVRRYFAVPNELLWSHIVYSIIDIECKSAGEGSRTNSRFAQVLLKLQEHTLTPPLMAP